MKAKKLFPDISFRKLARPSVPVDNLESTDVDRPLSANMGRKIKDDFGIPINATMLLTKNLTSDDNKTMITIPNAESYKAIVIKIYGDSNNGQTFYCPRAMFGILQPYSMVSSNANFPTTSGYSCAVHGYYTGKNIYIHNVIIYGWSVVQLDVYGLN